MIDSEKRNLVSILEESHDLTTKSRVSNNEAPLFVSEGVHLQLSLLGKVKQKSHTIYIHLP